MGFQVHHQDDPYLPHLLTLWERLISLFFSFLILQVPLSKQSGTVSRALSDMLPPVCFPRMALCVWCACAPMPLSTFTASWVLTTVWFQSIFVTQKLCYMHNDTGTVTWAYHSLLVLQDTGIPQSLHACECGHTTVPSCIITQAYHSLFVCQLPDIWVVSCFSCCARHCREPPSAGSCRDSCVHLPVHLGAELEHSSVSCLDENILESDQQHKEVAFSRILAPYGHF